MSNTVATVDLNDSSCRPDCCFVVTKILTERVEDPAHTDCCFDVEEHSPTASSIDHCCPIDDIGRNHASREATGRVFVERWCISHAPTRALLAARPRPTPTPSRAHPSRRCGFFACPPSIRGAGRWLGLSPGELAPLSWPRSGGAKSRRRGPCAQLVRPARAWFRSPSSASLTDSSATVYVAGVVLGLGSLGAGGDRRLAVALVSFRCLTCLFDGCLTIL